MHKYAWNRMQDRLLNNQQFRNIANEPMFKANCIKSNPLQLLGNAKGEPAQIEWQVNARRVTKNGGPFQWWKRYQMCDSHVSMCLEQPGQCAAYDKCLKGFPGVNPTYGGKLCNPKCEKSDTVMETSLAADVGLYFHFESDPKTGQPHGCAFPENLDDWQEPDTGFLAGTKMTYPHKCGKETHAPEGEALHKIVEDYASNQQKWFDDFIPIVHKMSANGYKESDLKTYDFSFESMLSFVPACKNKYNNNYPC